MQPPSTGQAPQGPVGAASLQPIATKPRRNSNGASFVAVAAVVVVALAGYGLSVFHAQSAPATLKTFYSNLSTYKFDDAFHLICPSKQAAAKASFATYKMEFQTLQQANVTIDMSQLQFDLKDSGLTSANVHVHGALKLAGASGANIPPIPYDETDPMALNGISWCVNIDQFATAQ